MPDTGTRHPRPAFVEDWDDDAQTTLSSSRATANVAVKRSQTGLVSERPKTKPNDGSDSGYSSKAPTVGSASTGAGKMGGLKIDTTIQERERHPYLISSQGNPVRREHIARPSAATNAPAAVREPAFVHPKGLCMTCDYYGQHIDLPQTAGQPPTPISPKVPKKTSGEYRKDQDSNPLKPCSSAPTTRPPLVPQSPVVQPVFSANPYAQVPTWGAPITPVTYSYATPTTSTYVGPAAQTSYFGPESTSQARPKATRRSTGYGEPIIQQQSKDDKKTVAFQKDTRSKHGVSRSKDQGPTSSTREDDRRPTASTRQASDRPSRSIPDDYEANPSRSTKDKYDSRPSRSMTDDFDKRPRKSTTDDYESRPSKPITDEYDERPSRSTDESDRAPAEYNERDYDRRVSMSQYRVDRDSIDRMNMPPPANPKKQVEVSRRPSLKKSSTYNPEIIDHRRSRASNGYDDVDARLPPSPRAREASPTRPPSSYRGPPPQDPPPSRPQPSRKSVSYSDAVSTTKISQSASASKSDALGRRVTNSTSSMEQKTAEAEAYQQSRCNMTSEELTVERLNDLKKQRSNTQSSETGSAFSHRESHHSSSRGSSGRGKSHTSGHRTSILFDSGIKLDMPADYKHKGRPVSIDLGGGVTLSVGAKDKNLDPKLIEKAPSVASHASKRSTTSATLDSRDHTESVRVSRRPSHNEERRPPVTDRSQRSSRQPSRAPSLSRASKRQSADYSGGYSGW